MTEVRSERPVTFYSDGVRLDGDLHLPGDLRPGEQRPGIVLCVGFGGIRQLIMPQLADSLADAGHVVLRFDHRGFGTSDGTRWRLIPDEQVRDIRDAVTFLSLQPEVDRSRIGLFGTSFGGGNAISAAALDDRVRCVVAAVPVGDGRAWLRGLRRWHEWKAFLARLDVDRDRRVVTGVSEEVETDEIMVPDPESDRWHQEVLERFPERAYRLRLETAEAVIGYSPEAHVHRIAPRAVLIIHAGDDDLVPLELSERLFHRAGEPKALRIVPGAKHHELFSGEPCREMMVAVVEWFARYLAD